MRRYSETRRQHPLAVGGSIREGIRLERDRLQGLRDMATRVIDTTNFNVHQLKDEIQRYAQEGSTLRRMSVTLLSFGYSFGIPYEADLLFDVRFLPNPYFVEELKRLNGDDPRVAGLCPAVGRGQGISPTGPGVHRFLLPLYEREGKTQLTIAVGCTGGRHRSMVMVNELAEILREFVTRRQCIPVCATPRCGEGMSGEMIGVVVVTHCHLAEELICRCPAGGGGRVEAV